MTKEPWNALLEGRRFNYTIRDIPSNSAEEGRARLFTYNRIINNKRRIRLRIQKSTGRAAGMTLIEVMIALVVLTVTVYMLTTTISAGVNHTATKFEKALASDAARNLLEEMRALPLSELYSRYNHDPADDPGGAGKAPGAYFKVDGLVPLPADADGFVGEVILPNTGTTLREDTTNATLGFPRDLNGDNIIDNKNHAADYIILPVGIKLEWKGKAGKQTFIIYSMFSKLKKE